MKAKAKEVLSKKAKEHPRSSDGRFLRRDLEVDPEAQPSPPPEPGEAQELEEPQAFSIMDLFDVAEIGGDRDDKIIEVPGAPEVEEPIAPYIEGEIPTQPLDPDQEALDLAPPGARSWDIFSKNGKKPRMRRARMITEVPFKQTYETNVQELELITKGINPIRDAQRDGWLYAVVVNAAGEWANISREKFPLAASSERLYRARNWWQHRYIAEQERQIWNKAVGVGIVVVIVLLLILSFLILFLFFT